MEHMAGAEIMKLDNIGPMRKPVSIQSLVSIFEQFRGAPIRASHARPPHQRVTMKVIICERCNASFAYPIDRPGRCRFSKSCTKS